MKLNLEGKRVWDLDADELEYTYRTIHINNYVYAALSGYLAGGFPLNRIVRLRKGCLPAAVEAAAQNFLELSPYLGNDDPALVRTNYVYRSYQLFKTFAGLEARRVRKVMAFLAHIAYIPIVAEKNDEFPLWFHPVVRKIDDRIRTIFNNVMENDRIVSQPDIWKFPNDSIEEIQRSDTLYVLSFVPRIAQSIIIMNENGFPTEQVQEAWLKLESHVRGFESEKGIGNTDDFVAGIKQAGQIRYRNTLYLYGGDFFRRQGQYKMAADWYLKEIFIDELPQLFGFYLTDMKTCERLLCAYKLITENEIEGYGDQEKKSLRRLIDNCAYSILQHAAQYGDQVLVFVDEHPDVDLAKGRIESNGKVILYGGEASREPFLFALLYLNFVEKVPFRKIDYTRFLSYKPIPKK